MELLIKIPKEFEQRFKQDAFEDSLHRLSADAHLIAGLYEQETAKMLRDAFKNAIPVQRHGRLIDADALKASIVFAEKTAKWAVPALRAVLMVIDEMPTLIPASEEGEWWTE